MKGARGRTNREASTSTRNAALTLRVLQGVQAERPVGVGRLDRAKTGDGSGSEGRILDEAREVVFPDGTPQ